MALLFVTYCFVLQGTANYLLFRNYWLLAAATYYGLRTANYLLSPATHRKALRRFPKFGSRMRHSTGSRWAGSSRGQQYVTRRTTAYDWQTSLYELLTTYSLQIACHLLLSTHYPLPTPDLLPT